MRINDKKALARLATQFSLFVAVTLFMAKLVALVQTNSLSLFSTVVDSFFDMTTSLLNFLVLGYAHKPADDNHRFGHGKAEALASLCQAILMAIMAVYVGYEGIKRFINPVPIENPHLGISVMIFSLAATFILVIFQTYVAKKTGSLIVKTDSLHYISDLLTNSAIIAAFIIYDNYNITYIDSALALLIAGYVIYEAFKLGYNASHHLLDHEVSDEIKSNILDAIKNIQQEHKEIKGIDDLKTREAGHTIFIQFNLVIDGNIPLKEAHKLTHIVEDIIRVAIPNSEVLIHQEVA